MNLNFLPSALQYASGPPWSAIFSIAQDSDLTLWWSSEKVGGVYLEPTLKLLVIPADSATASSLHAAENAASTIFEGDGVDILKLFTFSRNNQLGF